MVAKNIVCETLIIHNNSTCRGQEFSFVTVFGRSGVSPRNYQTKAGAVYTHTQTATHLHNTMYQFFLCPGEVVKNVMVTFSTKYSGKQTFNVMFMQRNKSSNIVHAVR